MTFDCLSTGRLISGNDNYGGPKGSNTNQFTKTQNSLPKHKTVYQNTNQLPKTQISLPKHKSISQNTNQFTKTQNNFSKYKPIFQNTNQFTKTQINFTKHKPISRNTNQKTGHLLCHYQRAFPRIFRVQHGDFLYAVRAFENVLPQLWV